MKNGNELSERKKQILKAVVEAHIHQGEPIGSKYLMQNHAVALSSATIRNEMAELEELGYLEQPHTSAGRIPSEAGYRFYVNTLMESYRLTSMELRELNDLVKEKTVQLDQILDQAGHLMSSLTNYTSLSLRSRHHGSVVRKFKLMPLDQTSFLMAILLDADHVKTRCIHTDLPFTEASLERLENVLNRTLAGQDMDTVTVPMMMKMEEQMGKDAPLMGIAVKQIYEALREDKNTDLKVDGVNRLLEYPEYSSAEQLRGVLGSFEDKEGLFDVILNAKSDGVNVYIGSENPLDATHNSSLVFKTISSGERVLGAIGVIGPRRMDYSKVITTVEYLSESIAQMLDDGMQALPRPPGEKKQEET